MFRALVSLLYPSFCSGCRVLVMPDVVLCSSCERLVISVPVLYRTFESYSVPIHAVSAYEAPVQGLVRAKERKQIYAARQLGRLMVQYSSISELIFDCIIPVPLHWMRQYARGYNQASVMATIVATQYPGVSLIYPFRRIRATKSQRELDAAERKNNVRNAFARSQWWSEQACQNALADKRVLLIDDVYTTGATLEALIALVAAYKPASITILVGCRVV